MIFLAASDRVSTATVDIQNFAVLPQLWQPPVLEHIERQAGDTTVRLSCGYWCNADILSITHALADTLGLPPSQLGDLRLQTTTDLVSDHESWIGLAIVYLDASQVGVASRWLNADGSITSIQLAPQVSLYGSAVLMPTGARVSFASPVKLAVIPVLQQPRPLWDYYIGSALWQPLVSTHHTSSALGSAFFRERTAHPLKWHAFAWVYFGVLCLVALMLSAVHYTRPGTVGAAAEIVLTTTETTAKTVSLIVATATTGLIIRGRAGVTTMTTAAETAAEVASLIVTTTTAGLVVHGRAGVTTMIALLNRCRRSRPTVPDCKKNDVPPPWAMNMFKARGANPVGQAWSCDYQSRARQDGSARRFSQNRSQQPVARALSPHSPKEEHIDRMA